MSIDEQYLLRQRVRIPYHSKIHRSNHQQIAVEQLGVLRLLMSLPEHVCVPRIWHPCFCHQSSVALILLKKHFPSVLYLMVNKAIVTEEDALFIMTVLTSSKSPEPIPFKDSPK